MNSLYTIISLLIIISVLIPFFGITFRIVRKLVQVLAIPTFWGCIAFLGAFNLGEFKVGETTNKRYPQETLATVHFILSVLILRIWYLGFGQGIECSEIHESLISLYVFNLICLCGVLLISLFAKSDGDDNGKHWIDKLLKYKFSLGFYKNLTN